MRNYLLIAVAAAFVLAPAAFAGEVKCGGLGQQKMKCLPPQAARCMLGDAVKSSFSIEREKSRKAGKVSSID